jgi:hypothetical protein
LSIHQIGTKEGSTMSNVSGPGRRRPTVSTAGTHGTSHAGAVPPQVQAKAAQKAAKTVIADRTGTAKGSHGAAETAALAHAKEKLVSGDVGAKFASGLKDLGSFATKLGKGIHSAEDFMGKLTGALDKTMKGLQDGMQFAEKLGGFENQLKGTFEALTNITKTVMQLADSLKALLGGGQTAPAPAQGGPAPAQGGPAPAQGGPAPAQGGPAPAQGGPAPAQGGPAPAQGGPAPAQGGPAPAQGGPAPAQGGPAPAQGGPAPAQGGPAPAQGGPAPAEGKLPIPELDWKPDTHTSSSDISGGYDNQQDLRTSGGTTTQWKEVTEKQTIMETKQVDKVRDLPPKEKTGPAVFYPNDIPKPGTERTVTPENKKYATDFIEKNLDDLKKPGAKLDITGLCSAPASDAYNMALGQRRAVNTREAFAQVLKDKGFSDEKINELLPKESELKSKGNREAKVGVNDGIDKQQSDRRTDVKLTVPGGKEKYTETVQVPKEIEVKKQVPVTVQKPIAVAADNQIGGPGMNIGAHVEIKQLPNGDWDLKTSDSSKPIDMDALMKNYYGGGDPAAALSGQLSAQQANLGQWAQPVNNLLTGALNGNPSAAAFQAPLQQFGQAMRNDLLSRPDLQGPPRKSIEGLASRVDTAAARTMNDLNSLIASYSAGGGDGGRGPVGVQLDY